MLFPRHFIGIGRVGLGVRVECGLEVPARVGAARIRVRFRWMLESVSDTNQRGLSRFSAPLSQLESSNQYHTSYIAWVCTKE